MTHHTQECRRCVMDASAADIAFGFDGNCNYCRELMARLAACQPANAAVLADRLHRFVDQVRREGRGKRYDCIVGVSGGADSAYALYLAKQHGLRPLAVHMDNGWNSELAVNNIENLVRKLDVDLVTHVIEWREYRALQQAFFDADVIDIELLYDNAMAAVNYRLARHYGIRYILAGSNTSTEGMRMPPNYAWYKFDRQNILALGRRAGVRTRSMPTIGVAGFVSQRYLRRILWVPFLDYIDYNKQACIDLLVKEIGYRPYPYKHYESHPLLPGLPAAAEVRRRQAAIAFLIADLLRPDDARAGGRAARAKPVSRPRPAGRRHRLLPEKDGLDAGRPRRLPAPSDARPRQLPERDRAVLHAARRFAAPADPEVAPAPGLQCLACRGSRR
jgi:hypothetical protein